MLLRQSVETIPSFNRDPLNFCVYLSCEYHFSLRRRPLRGVPALFSFVILLFVLFLFAASLACRFFRLSLLDLPMWLACGAPSAYRAIDLSIRRLAALSACPLSGLSRSWFSILLTCAFSISQVLSLRRAGRVIGSKKETARPAVSYNEFLNYHSLNSDLCISITQIIHFRNLYYPERQTYRLLSHNTTHFVFISLSTLQ